MRIYLLINKLHASETLVAPSSVKWDEFVERMRREAAGSETVNREMSLVLLIVLVIFLFPPRHIVGHF